MNLKSSASTRVHLPSTSVWLPTVAGLLLAGATASAQTPMPDYQSTVIPEPIPSETAAREALRLSAGESTLRLGGLDLFPHVSAMVRYDDNVLISHDDPIEDVRWSLAPGLSVMGGDVATYVPGSVTVDQLRKYLYYSLVEDVSKPKRFGAADYTPSFNAYTKESDFNGIDHSAQASAGYGFTRLALGFDANFRLADEKNNSVGTLLRTTTYDAQLRARYDLGYRTWLQSHLGFRGTDYESPLQGYDEPDLGLGLGQQLSEKLSAGLGFVAGLTLPEQSEDQYYEQLLVNGTYRLSGKLQFNAAVGVEFRQYRADVSDSTHFVFRASGLYQPTARTSLTLEAHRRDEPSPFGGQNTETLGASLAVRQELRNRFSVGATLGYDFSEYRDTDTDVGTDRQDDYLVARANLNYEFNRRWRAMLFYDFRRLESSDNALSYFNNLIGLEVFWRF